jgi:hypothetical protein
VVIFSVAKGGNGGVTTLKVEAKWAKENQSRALL